VEDEQRGQPIAYTALSNGTPVYLSDETTLLGRVKRVMAVPEKDIFDGIVVTTVHGDRFVDAPETGAMYENAIFLRIDADEATRLPDPEGNPAVMSVGPDDAAEGSARFGISRAAKRFWGRISGNY
jgi:hypothetical protein